MMKDKTLEKQLKNLIIEPDEKWLYSTRKLLKEKINLRKNKKDVTDTKNIRNLSIVFNFLKFLIMDKKAKFALTSVATIAILIGGNLVLYKKADAAASGDALYSLDKAYESLKRAVTLSDSARLQLELDLMKEREEELKELLESAADPATLNTATEEIMQQEERVREQLQLMKEKGENEDELTQTQDELERHIENTLQLMNKIEDDYMTEDKKEDDDVKELEKQVREYKQEHERYEDKDHEDDNEKDESEMREENIEKSEDTEDDYEKSQEMERNQSQNQSQMYHNEDDDSEDRHDDKDNEQEDNDMHDEQNDEHSDDD